MTKTVWAVDWAYLDSNTLGELLYEGWEPFTVTGDTVIQRIWLRKIVRVEVKNEKA